MFLLCLLHGASSTVSATFALCKFASVPVRPQRKMAPNEEDSGFIALLEILTPTQPYRGGWPWPVEQSNFIAIIMCAVQFRAEYVCSLPYFCQSPSPTPPSLFMSARFTSFSLSVCLQSNSQMIIHLAAFDSSRQTQGLRSSTRGQINTFSPLFLLLSSLHFQSLLSYYTECYVYFNLHPC